MTYAEFLERNTNLRHAIRDKEENLGLPTEKRRKFLRINTVDFDKGLCKLSTNEIIPIYKVIQIVTMGVDCISNPSILANWSGFKSEIEKKEDKEVENMDVRDFNITMFMKNHKGERILYYASNSAESIGTRCVLMDADNLGFLVYTSDKEGNTFVEYVLFTAVKSIRFLSMTKENEAKAKLDKLFL